MVSKSGSTCNVKYLIVDSAGFIKNASLKDIGEEIYTTEQVVTEIRDKATRSRLQVLPYELKFKTPSVESIKFVTDFSKKTGDYASLSSVDLKVIALTFQVHKEHGDASQIKSEPNKNVVIEAQPKYTAPPKGFYFEKNENKNNNNADDKDDDIENEQKLTEELDKKCFIEKDEEDNIKDDDDNIKDGDDDNENIKEDDDNMKGGEDDDQGYERSSDEDEWFSSEDLLVETDENTTNNNENEIPNLNYDEENSEDDKDDDEENTDGYEEDDEDDGDEEDDDTKINDEEGWITPKNIASFKKSSQPALPSESVKVACLTTDFAMQNVLIQMGLNIVSLNGLLIRHARSYVLKCSACFKVTKDISKVFCHHCGNQTLQKVSMTVNDDGSIVYHMSKNKQANIRGLRYALPTPKGGKQAHNPILCSDQLASTYNKSKKQHDTLDPGYTAREQPFSMHALNAKGAGRTTKNWDVQPTVGKRKNPNVNSRYKGKNK